MKHMLTVSALFISFFTWPYSIRAQTLTDADTSVDCVTNWKWADTRTYSIVHSKSTAESGHPETVTHFAYEARISVLDSTANDYTIKWLFHVPDPAKSGIRGLTGAPPYFEGMQMIFRISGTGSFIELINWEEVRDDYTKMMEASLPKEQDSALTAVVKTARELFNKKESVESSLIREIQLFHVPYGYKFTTSKVSAETKLSNPFGGAPLPAVQSFQITKLDPERDRFTLAVRQHIDRGSLTGMLDELIAKMRIKDKDKKESMRTQLKALEMDDYTEYQFIRSTGWMQHIYYERTAVVAGMKQTETYTIDLKD